MGIAPRYNIVRTRYPYDLILKKRLADGTICQDDADLITSFVRTGMGLNKMGPNGAQGAASSLCQWRRFFPMSFREANFKDVLAAINAMQTGKSWFGKPYAHNTFAVRVAILKSFLKHSNLPKLDMKDIMSIEIPEEDILSVSSTYILTNADIDKLIAHASYPRDRAWFTVLFEAGCRGIEAAGLQWKDVAFQDDGTIILTVLSMKRKSKKKPRIRNAYILERGSYLRELRQLQASDTEEDYVFRAIHGGPNMVTTKEGVLYCSMSKMLERTAKRAGVVLPPREKTKLLRTSSVTDKRLRGVPDNLIKDSTWAAGENSSMMPHYSRLTPRNKLDAFKAAYGITPTTAKTPPVAETITCIRCGSRNGPLTKFCPKCNTAVTSEAMREQAKASEFTAILMKDPTFRKKLDEHLKK